jgi:tetratricopeptide (TPR) repeat protein
MPKNLIKLISLLVVLPIASSTLHAQAADAEAKANAALAERIAHLAQLSLRGRPITPETLRQTAAMLEAAMRLAPGELRHARLAAEAALQMRDSETAINAFKAIKRIDPDDQVAHIRLMDLYVSRMETADQRLDYLSRLIGSEGIHSEVRSHAAYLSALTQLERDRRGDADRLLDEALKLFPLSPDALQKKWELSAEDMPPDKRVELLMAMLMSNPAQPGIMADLGGILGDLGLAEQSLRWYAMAMELGRAVGRGIEGDDVTRYLSQLVITDQSTMAEQVLTRLLESNPGNVDAAFLGMLIQRRSGNPEKLQKALDDARNALATLAQNLHQRISPAAETTSATQEAPALDLAADVKALLELKDPELTAVYASLLGDLAWVNCYFTQKPDEAQNYVALLQQLVPADSTLLARLEGWQLLASNRVDEAKVKLSAVADRDPIAALGMILIREKDPAEKQRVRDDARKLFEQNPSGLMGAIIVDTLRDRIEAGKGLPVPPSSEAVRDMVEKFPTAWLEFIAKPNSFYSLKAEPLKVAHGFAEPVLAQVTIKNIGEFPITIAQDGALRPDLWFDLQLRGLVQQGIQGVTFDRLGQVLVLQPGKTVSQVLRVDQGQVSSLLNSNPSVSIPLYFSVFTNPITLPTGISPGPGGQRVQFTRVVNRIATPLANEQVVNAAIAALSGGPPEQRMAAADLLTAYAMALLAQKDEKFRATGQEMIAAIKKSSTRDQFGAVRAWSSLMLPRLTSSDEQREQLIGQMLAGEQWTERLLGLFAVQSFDHAKWKQLASPLAEGDPDPTVKKLAQAIVEFADSPASTQPATQPAEGAAAPPQAASGQ